MGHNPRGNPKTLVATLKPSNKSSDQFKPLA